MPATHSAPQTSAEARAYSVAALEADLVGPMARDPNGIETLPLPPSRWYLTGFLAPAGGRTIDKDDLNDPEGQDELGRGSDVDEPEADPDEPQSKRKSFFPASMGVSVLLPSAPPGEEIITVTLTYADYAPIEHEPPPAAEEEDGKRTPRDRPDWQRVPRSPPPLSISLDPTSLATPTEVPDSKGIEFEARLVPTSGPGLPPGTRALSLFIVNRREPAAKAQADLSFIFQVELRLDYTPGFLPRPNLTGEGSVHFDDAVADLQFRNHMEYAVGHGVSVSWGKPSDHDQRVRDVHTRWLPRAEVKRVITHEVDGVTTNMERLALLKSADDVRDALQELPRAYEAWIADQWKTDIGEGTERKKIRKELLEEAEKAQIRIADGIELLATSSQVRRAFCLANQAMAMQSLRRSPERYDDEKRPSWRLFQLAFVLLNLHGLTDPHHKDRKNVELIFFPTGGGKTEAYLGCIAYTLVLRRLRGRQRPDQGLGVAVLLRYTLRLLTLDQLERAATLVFALEKIRRNDPELLGTTRFSIGLWVGRSATANTLAMVSRQLDDFAADRAKSPFPLSRCPWCKEPIGSKAMELKPSKSKAERVDVACLNFRECEFSRSRSGEPLPILFVDEEIYRELPCFIVATVDKFALLPWRGEVGKLFGRVNKHVEYRHFFSSADARSKTGVPGNAEPLPDGLRPSELIVQDELHLISGPLGTMVGLYETAIEAMCTYKDATGEVLPKIVSSTATVKRAKEQIHALFGRERHAVFPPPAVDVSETFFAKVDEKSNGRLYVGVAASGRPLKAILLRTYIPLLGAGHKFFDAKGPEGQVVDPYMTLAGYFNSLRELGGMRRLVDDEVRLRLRSIHDRRPLGMKKSEAWLRGRELREVAELTSREETAAITEVKTRLGFDRTVKGSVDVVLASNMISVGVDIDRLGLMVVAGQPKSTNEYIQATSRVGRDHNRPGLVVTVFNLNRPRDRSHYERFVAYHHAFYRFVEATSVTPFSGPALERGLTGLVVGLTRHRIESLTPWDGVMELADHRKEAEKAVEVLAKRAAGQQRIDDADDEEIVYKHILSRAIALLDAWEAVVRNRDEDEGGDSCYSPWDPGRKGKSLLFIPTEDNEIRKGREKLFDAPTSMRDVEASVHLWIDRG